MRGRKRHRKRRWGAAKWRHIERQTQRRFWLSIGEGLGFRDWVKDSFLLEETPGSGIRWDGEVPR